MTTVDREREQRFIDEVFLRGGFWDPVTCPEGGNVKYSDLPNLRLTDRVVQDAVRSMQQHAPLEMDRETLRLYGRMARADGDVGAATLAVVEDVPTCGCPNFAPPEGVDLRGVDADTLAVLKGYQAMAATGSGSWPAGCHSEQTGVEDTHEVFVHVDKSNMPPRLSGIVDEAFELVRVAMLTVGVRLVFTESPGLADVRVSWRSLRGSTIGLAQFPDGTCMAGWVFCYLDPEYPNFQSREANLIQLAALILHELGGHNMRVGHTRGGVMNPSIIVWRSWPGWAADDPARPILERYFGGPIDDPVEPPTPQPPAGTYRIALTGTLVPKVYAEDGTEVDLEHERFIVVPE